MMWRMSRLVAAAKRIDRALFKTFKEHFARELQGALEGCDSVLDVGCGVNSPLERLPRRLSRSVGVDLHEPWLAKSKGRGVHDDYVVADVLELDRHFPPQSFDAVLASDLLEHLEKADGFRLLDLMERVARKRVVVFTPNGFIEQHETDGNPLQVHRSGWSADEMARRGYYVTGINGWKPLRGEYAVPKWKPRVFWYRISQLSQPFVASRPAHAFAILCVKAVDARPRRDTNAAVTA